MEEKWEQLYTSLLDQMCRLIFGHNGVRDTPGKRLMEAWMRQNNLSADDLKTFWE